MLRWSLIERAISGLSVAATCTALLSCSGGSLRGGEAVGLYDVNSAVLEYHGDPSRAGVYVDAAFTPVGAARIHLDRKFNGQLAGPVVVQPLYFENVAGGKKVLIVATTRNLVYALDAATGEKVWKVSLGAPVFRAKRSCGATAPVGIGGTPIIDQGSRTVFLDALTTPDNGKTEHHKIFALSLDDGSVRPGWPLDVSAAVKVDGLGFDSAVQSQTAALALLNGVLYVGYGGESGSGKVCGKQGRHGKVGGSEKKIRLMVGWSECHCASLPRHWLGCRLPRAVESGPLATWSPLTMRFL